MNSSRFWAGVRCKLFKVLVKNKKFKTD